MPEFGFSRIKSGKIEPLEDNTYDIGKDTLRWRDIYLSGKAYASEFVGTVDYSNIHLPSGVWTNLNADELDGYHASDFAPASHTHTRSEVTDFWNTPFWTNIPDKPFSTLGSEFTTSDGELQISSVDFSKITNRVSSLITFDSDLVPNTDNAFSLGNANYRWKDGWFGGSVYVGGRVGIGTTSPAHPLHIYTSGYDGLKIESSGAKPSIYLTGYDGSVKRSIQITTGFYGRALEIYFPESGYYVSLVPPRASSTNTITRPPNLMWYGGYWDGTSSQWYVFKIMPEVLDTTPTGRLRFNLPGVGDILVLHSSEGVQVGDNLKPTSDNAYDLGSSSYYWRNIYWKSTLYGGSGAKIDFADEEGDKILLWGNTFGIGIESATLKMWVRDPGNAHYFKWYRRADDGTETLVMYLNTYFGLLPGQDDTYNLGSDGMRWHNIYYKGTLYGGSAEFSGTLTLSEEGVYVKTSDLTAQILKVRTGDVYGNSVGFGGANGALILGAGEVWRDAVDNIAPNDEWIFLVSDAGIHFYVAQGSGWGTGYESLKLSSDGINYSRSILPLSDNAYDLGTESLRWRNAYFGGVVTIEYPSEYQFGALLYVKNSGTGEADAYIKIEGSGTGEEGIFLYHSGEFKGVIESGAYYGNDIGIASIGKIRLGITSGWPSLTWVANVTGSGVIPASDNAYDLGSNSYYWRNIYWKNTLYGGSGAKIDFAEETGDKILLWGNTYGIGIESGTLKMWVRDSGIANYFRWYRRTDDGTETLVMYLNTYWGLCPGQDDAYNLGSDGMRWHNIYYKGTLYGGSAEFSGAVKADWNYEEVIYVSPSGGGDGSSSSSPTTLDDALTRAKARKVTICLADGEYHISKDYVITCDRLYIKSLSGDPSSCKIIFDTFLSGSYNASYSIEVFRGHLIFCRVTLENAPKVDDSAGWAVSSGDLCPIVLGAGMYYGVNSVTFDNCVINQTRDYFVSTKHTFGSVSFLNTTVNMSDDAVAVVLNSLGTCAINIYNSTVPSGYKWVKGLAGTYISSSYDYGGTLPGFPTIKPDADNTYDLGSNSYMWRDVYAYEIRKASDFAIKFDGENLVFYEPEDSNAVAYQILDAGAGGNFTHEFYSSGLRLKIDSSGISPLSSIVPMSDNTYDLGSESLRWRNGYFADTVYASQFVGNIDWSYVQNAPLVGVVLAFDDTEAMVTGTTETEVKYFRFVRDSSFFNVKKIRFIVSGYSTSGTGQLKVYIDGTAYATIDLTSTSEGVYQADVDVSSLSDGIHTVSIRLVGGSSSETVVNNYVMAVGLM